ncbi:major facilitator superfamily domain-containing protein [Phthorimaea operculella]|nr:major facilitator superfamily domain-containing protein [Phthorimaea operculella]
MEPKFGERDLSPPRKYQLASGLCRYASEVCVPCQIDVLCTKRAVEYDAEEHLDQSEKIPDNNCQVNVKSKEFVKSDDAATKKVPLITMELPMFLSMLSISLAGIAVNNIVMYRTCVHVMELGEEICSGFLAPDKSNISKEVETEVQQYMTAVHTSKIVLEAIGPAILSFFLGAWSDTHGRKPVVIWALFGLAVSQILVVVYSTINWLGPWWILVTGIPNAFLGYMVLFTGAMCFVADISTPQDRSLRLTIVQIVLSIGQIIGQVASSFLVQLVGNVYLLSLSAGCTVVAFVYTHFCIKESLKGATKGGITSVLKFSLVKDMFRVVFKRRPNKGRAQILLLIITNTFIIFIVYGMMNLDYMYTRNKFQWSMREFTIFTAVGTAIGCVGGFVGVAFIQRIFSVPDLAFIAFAFFSAAVECVIRAFATVGWHFYLSVCISVFSGLSGPLIRSILSKMILVTDIAKVFALLGAIEGLSPLVAPTLYNFVYNITLHDFPGAIYMLSFVFYVSCIIMVGVVQYFIRRALTNSRRDEKHPDDINNNKINI